MQFSLTFVLAMSCILPALTGLIIYRHAALHIRSFIHIMWLAVGAELIARVGVSLLDKNITGTVYNIYIILNIYLYLLFFYACGTLKKQALYILLILSAMVWTGCLALQRTLQSIAMYAHMFNGIIIVILTTQLLGRQVFRSRELLFRNFYFWFAIGAVLQYLFFIFITSLMLLGTGYDLLRTKMFFLYAYVNAASYILFTIALLCHRKARTYTR